MQTAEHLDVPLATMKKQSRSRRSWPATLRGLAMIVVTIAACAAAVIHVVPNRIKHQHDINSRSIVLTADPISILSPRTGTVVDTFVVDGQTVNEGVVLASVDFGPDHVGGRNVVEDILAPSALSVTHVRIVRGETIIGGEELVQGYDASKVYFTAPVSYENATKVARRDTVTVKFKDIANVEMTPGAIETDFDSQGVTEGNRSARIKLVPKNPADLAKLGIVPGVKLEGTILLP